MSYPFAKHYIDQFPKKKTESAARTVQFFSGALIAVLAFVGFSDPEMFVDFELFPGMNAFAFAALMTTVWAVARGMISEENDVFDPEFAMQNVIEYTHYQPDQWKGRLHSFDVKTEFAELYKVSIVIFLEEIVGVLVTPLILFFSLPRCSDQIVDFFREFTIHVDGLGYVCSFAVFDFQKDARNAKQQPKGPTTAAPAVTTVDAREDYYSTKHGKMQASMHGFLDNYVYNPRSGLPGMGGGSHHHHHSLGGPAGRHQFHPPPPAFPGLMSPTLTADMRASRMGGGGARNNGEQPRSRAPPPGRTPRFGPAIAAPSPMASMLLDPHHQPPLPPPSASMIIPGRNPAQRARQQQRGPYQQGEGGIIEESAEDSSVAAAVAAARGTFQRQPTAYTDLAVEESVARLGESTWEEERSPPQPLTRENSAVNDEDRPGVVTLLKKFQETHMNHRGGVM